MMRIFVLRLLGLFFALASLSGGLAASGLVAAASPEALPRLELTAPIDRWDEAIPLGNGLMGGLLWGNGAKLRLSLDRGDLWDLRVPEPLRSPAWNYATIRKLFAEKNQPRISELFDKPYSVFPYATKIPAGRLEITLADSSGAESFGLDLKTAVGQARLNGGGLEAFYSATQPVAMLRLVGPQAQWRIAAPESLKRLGYPPPQQGQEGDTSWSLQEAALGLKYAVVVAGRRNGTVTEIALTITSTRDGPDPLALGRQRVGAALQTGYRQMLEPHVEWWRQFWAKSSIRVPEQAVQQHYALVQYFYGAASRRGSPPIPLQGVWTADEGTLPPWHGDYHHDLNTQLTYWAYLSAGHWDEGRAFLDFMFDLLPVHRQFARQFYQAPGAAVPGVMTLDGKPMGGWCQYSLSPTNGAWVAQAFYLHWRYTMDRQFLKERAYPYCSAIAECLESLLQPGPDGSLKLPLSTSPEIHNNSLQAWLTPNSNYDLSLLRWLYGAVAEMARDANDEASAQRWQKVFDRLAPLAVESQTSMLRVSPDESLTESHRHFSHLMAIHPLGTLTVDGSEGDRKTITASLAQLEQLGTRMWCGYSFSWMACLAARTGQAEMADKYLDIYLKAFISRNGFHLNGDYKKLGYSSFTYRPFTLEGNFAAAQAVHEMLLQSWGGRVRIFPAVPGKWRDVSFQDLRAQGAFVVSAQRANGETVRVQVRSEQGGLLRLRDPFAGKRPSWNRVDVQRVGDDYQCTLRPGEILEGQPQAE